MALTGLEIYKKLPRTNCKDCGFPTCLAFAMKLAAKQVELGKCPHVSAEAKAALDSASKPPIQLVTIGVGDNELKVGNETQLYRHEEKFHRPAGIAVRISDTLSEEEIAARAEAIGKLVFERVGTTIRVNLVAVDNESGDEAKFLAAARIAAEKSGKALVLMSASAGTLKKAAEAHKQGKPLLYLSDASQIKDLAAAAKAAGCPVAVRAQSLDEAATITADLEAAGIDQIVLDPGARGLKATLAALSSVRRLSLKNFRPLGFPCIAFTTDADPVMQVVEASTYITKYAAVVVTDAIEKWQALTMLTTRQDIYTDPQKPVAVEPKLNAVGEVTDASPVMVTTNFSLSYYSVEGEVEASRVPAYIIAVDTEGTSVLTAWASDKFNATTITEAMQKAGIADKVKHRKLVIPGLVAVLSGGIEDESGWQVLIGPKEASGLPSYLKTQWKAD
jgi:acetyl-CoA decarbonylase/synthase complex subunit gamma